jgi:hypothetical protein
METSGAPGVTRRSKRRTYLILALIAGFVLAGVLSVALPVVPRDFSGSVIEYGCPNSSNCSVAEESPSLHSFPLGSTVRFDWNAQPGVSVRFYVYGPSGSPVETCSQLGQSGTCRFVANGQSYQFAFDWGGNLSEVAIEFAGTYTSPLL